MKRCHLRVQRGASLWPTLAMLVVVAATLALGRWQLARAAEKTALQASLLARGQAPVLDLADPAVQAQPAADLRFRRAVAQGTYDVAHQIYLDNREDQGTPGFHVLTPLRLGARVVLVNRGFVARDAHYPQAPAVPADSAPQRVEGVLTVARTRYVELSGEVVSGPVWQNLDLTRYARTTGLVPLDVVLLAQPAGAGLRTVHDAPAENIAMHRGYAFQWFSLAATALGLYGYLTFLRKAPHSS